MHHYILNLALFNDREHCRMVTSLILLSRSMTDNTAEWLPTSSCFVQWQRRPDWDSPSLCSEHPAQSWQNYESPSLRKEVPPLPRPLYSENKLFSHDGQFAPSPVFSLHTFFSLDSFLSLHSFFSLHTFFSLNSFLSLHSFFSLHFLQFAHFL